MYKVLFVLAAYLWFQPTAESQCKYFDKGLVVKKAQKSSGLEIDFMTKRIRTLDKFSFAGSGSFIQSKNADVFFGLGINRVYSKRFSTFIGDPLILHLTNGHDIKLFPIDDFESKYSPPWSLNLILLSYYSISKEQIQKIADNQLTSITFYVTSGNELKNGELDENGKNFFYFDLNREKVQGNLAKTANCFLKRSPL